MKVTKKPKLDSPLWARISRKNRDWIDALCKKLDRSRSEVLDMLVTEVREELAQQEGTKV